MISGLGSRSRYKMVPLFSGRRLKKPHPSSPRNGSPLVREPDGKGPASGGLTTPEVCVIVDMHGSVSGSKRKELLLRIPSLNKVMFLKGTPHGS